jgi:hypothetical protein
MAVDDLQEVVDSLALRLGRAAEIYDAQLSLLAYSAGQAEGDPVRLATILDRQPSDGVRAHLAHNTQDDEPYSRVPADPTLGMRARACVPVRCQQLLLGYIWLMEDEPRLNEGELEEAMQVARHVGQVLYRHRMVRQDQQSAARRLINALCVGDGEARAQAADELLGAGQFAAAESYCAIVARVHAPPQTSRQLLYVAVGAALERARRLAPPYRALCHQNADEGVVVLGFSGDGDATALRFAKKMSDFLAETTADLDHVRARVGIGDPRGRLDDIQGSIWEARATTDIAATVPALGNPVSWACLGSYRTIVGTLRDSELEDILPAGLNALLEHPDALVLTATLECYLDRAGDAQATAADLFVHRTSLYARLRRIEAITGLDLRDGDDRLALHLGMRMLRLAGRLPGTAPLSSEDRTTSGRCLHSVNNAGVGYPLAGLLRPVTSSSSAERLEKIS